MVLRSVDSTAWFELRLQGTGSAALLFALRLATPSLRLALDEVSFARRDLRQFAAECHRLASGEPIRPRLGARDLLGAELRLRPDTTPSLLRLTADLAWARAGAGPETYAAAERVTATFEIVPAELHAFAAALTRTVDQRLGGTAPQPTPRP